ncbi:hypothetical protein JCM6882_004639 [Rhodosporidiobolus microsporus]
MYARTAFINAARPAARQALPRNARVPVRSYSTANPQQGSPSSHLASGLLGGGVVLGGVYAYYKYTGADKVVSTAQSVSQTAKAAKDKLADAAPGSTKEALALAKSVAKSYAAAIPGGAYAIDRGFKELEDFVEKNGEAAEKLIKDTYADVAKAAKSGDNAGEAVVNALKEAGVKVQKLVGEEASKGWEKLGEKFPELKKNLGEQGQELQELAEKHGPEAQQIVTDFYQKASKLVAEGGFNAKTFEQAKKLLEEKKDELASFSQKAGRDAWDSAAKAAGPALDKMPDAKEALEQSLGKVEGYVGEDRVKAVKDLYAEISKIGSGEGSVEEKTKKAKDLIEEKVGKSSQFVALGLGTAAGKAGDIASAGKKWLDEQVPGLSGISKIFDEVDLAALKEVASKRGDEGKKLLDSTYAEIKEVLAKKSEEAKKLAEKSKEDAKDASKSK